MIRLYDSHNHLQDAALAPHHTEIMAALTTQQVAALVVNGTRETDWPRVLQLAKTHSTVVPSFGLHPWHVADRSPNWEEQLTFYINEVPAGIGEIGLDRWIENPDIESQELVFVRQLQIAAQRNLPVTIHCLRAWGSLIEILRAEPRPDCGFLLHSYGGSKELIDPLAELGAYFSISGYFAHERKERQRDVFRHVPADRLLIETDAPDMLPPPPLRPFTVEGRAGESDSRTESPHQPVSPLQGPKILAGETARAPETGEKPLNHPANIAAAYRFAAELRDQSPEELAQVVEANFNRLFGSIRRQRG